MGKVIAHTNLPRLGGEKPERSVTMFEKRIKRDSNGFYNVQVRILPVEDWQPNEGWGTVFVTSIYENAAARLTTEPGKEVA